jgi:hypothetical protein
MSACGSAGAETPRIATRWDLHSVAHICNDGPPMTNSRPRRSLRHLRQTAAWVSALILTTALAACKHNVYFDFSPPLVCETEAAIESSVFFIGDAGAPTLPDRESVSPDALVDPVLLALRRDVDAQVARLGAEHTAVVFLGDNIYPAGLALPGEAGHEHGKRVLEAQIASVGDAQGFFTLGNHDWDQGDLDRGWQVANAQTQYLSSRAANISVHPGGTCAGPEVVDFGDQIRFLFIDLWAAIYQIDTDNQHQASCAYRAGENTILNRMVEIFDESKGRELILVTHAPMMTTGPHGGYFPWREHVFPLRVFHRALWIPLPIIGSIFPLSRILGVTDTDMMSSNYTQYIEGGKAIFRPGVPSLVAAGHEHSLQVHIDPIGVMHAVSGAGSVKKVDYVREANSDLMSLAAPGYMRLDSYADHQLRLNVYALDDETERKLVYSTCVP